MGFGKNIQFLRKLYGKITQEELAEKMNVSRQTISKWELETAFPEMEKALQLCKLFSCSLDDLMQKDMDYYDDEAYSNIRVEEVGPLRYINMLYSAGNRRRMPSVICRNGLYLLELVNRKS